MPASMAATHRSSASSDRKLNWVDATSRHSTYEESLALLLARDEKPPPTFNSSALGYPPSHRSSSGQTRPSTAGSSMDAAQQYDRARSEIFGQRAGRVQGSIKESLLRQEVSARLRAETVALELKEKRREWRKPRDKREPKNSSSDAYLDELWNRTNRDEMSKSQQQRLSGSMAWNISTAPLNSEEVDLEELEPSTNPIAVVSVRDSDPITKEERVSLARSLIGLGNVEDGESILRSINTRSKHFQGNEGATFLPRSALAELFTELYTGADSLGGDLDREKTTARLSTRDEIAASWDKRYTNYEEKGPFPQLGDPTKKVDLDKIFKAFDNPKRKSPKSKADIGISPRDASAFSDAPGYTASSGVEKATNTTPQPLPKASLSSQTQSSKPRPLGPNFAPGSAIKTPQGSGQGMEEEGMDFTPRNLVKELLGRDLVFLEN